MTLNIGQRDKMFLIGGGVFVACYLLFFLVAEPIYKKQENINGKIKDKINFIEKYYEVLNQTSYYQAKEAANKNIKNNLKTYKTIQKLLKHQKNLLNQSKTFKTIKKHIKPLKNH